MAAPVLLLADNDLIFLEITSEFLRRHGYTVLCADSLETARKILQERVLALALIDYRLTQDDDRYDHSGLNLAREAAGFSSAPRFILTRLDDRADYAVHSLTPDAVGRAPAEKYLLKKDGLDNMLAAIERVVQRAKIFLSYGRPDETSVANLYDKLVEAGYQPWMDVKSLTGGEKWDFAIRRQIRAADFFILCLSTQTTGRRGYMQREIRQALQIWDEKLESDIYLLPVKLDPCDINDERLREFQWVNIYQPRGFLDLLRALQVGLARRRQDAHEYSSGG